MNTDQLAELSLTLRTNWPGKYTETDRAAWCKAMEQYPGEVVFAAITEWKNSSRKFAPMIPEILKLIRERQEPKERPASTGFAHLDQFIATRAEVRGEHQGESIPETAIHYHRALLHTYLAKEFGHRHADDLRPHELKRIEEKKAATVRACVSDLVKLRVPADDCERFAAAVLTSDRDEFHALLEELREQQAGVCQA